MRPSEISIVRQVQKIILFPPYQFNDQRTFVNGLARRYLPDSTELSIYELDKLCTYFDLEHESELNAFHHTRPMKVALARHSLLEGTGGPTVRHHLLEGMGRAEAASLANIADYLTAACIAFGDILVRELTLSWALVTDAYGPDIAVVNQDGNFAAFVLHLVPYAEIGRNPTAWRSAFQRVEGELCRDTQH